MPLFILLILKYVEGLDAQYQEWLFLIGAILVLGLCLSIAKDPRDN